jgi:hypothetical protein
MWWLLVPVGAFLGYKFFTKTPPGTLATGKNYTLSFRTPSPNMVPNDVANILLSNGFRPLSTPVMAPTIDASTWAVKAQYIGPNGLLPVLTPAIMITYGVTA